MINYPTAVELQSRVARGRNLKPQRTPRPLAKLSTKQRVRDTGKCDAPTGVYPP